MCVLVVQEGSVFYWGWRVGEVGIFQKKYGVFGVFLHAHEQIKALLQM